MQSPIPTAGALKVRFFIASNTLKL